MNSTKSLRTVLSDFNTDDYEDDYLRNFDTKESIENIPTKSLLDIAIKIYKKKQQFKFMSEKEVNLIIELYSRYAYFEDKKSKLTKSAFITIVKSFQFEKLNENHVIFHEGKLLKLTIITNKLL